MPVLVIVCRINTVGAKAWEGFEMQERSVYEIDLAYLERDWLEQAKTVFAEGMKLAEARQALNEAKSALEIVEAEQDMDVRLHPSKHGLDVLEKKPTETMVKNAVRLTKAYQTADEEVIRRQHDVDCCNASVTALEHKKRAMESLVQLQAMMYHADPKATGSDLRATQEVRANAVLGGEKKKAPAGTHSRK